MKKGRIYMSIMYKQLLSIFLYLIHGSYPNKLLNHFVTLVTHSPILILMILDAQTRISPQIEKCLVVVICHLTMVTQSRVARPLSSMSVIACS